MFNNGVPAHVHNTREILEIHNQFILKQADLNEEILAQIQDATKAISLLAGMANKQAEFEVYLKTQIELNTLRIMEGKKSWISRVFSRRQKK